MLNKITHEEYEMLNTWREWYGSNSDHYKSDNCIPVKDILVEWAESNDDLHKLLGNNLMITKNIEYHKGEDELVRDMNDMIAYGPKDTRQKRDMSVFIRAYSDWYDKAFQTHFVGWWEEPNILSQKQQRENEINFKIRNGLYTLIYVKTLANNLYEGEEFSITLPNGKPYVIRKGCKPLRALAKIAEAFNLEGFEDFRICHSLVHNNKKMKGELTLSIHPMDYWTMSDNDCNWESCMNWRDCGGYRQGTIEMMNSPCVVVAYIAEKEPMSVCHQYEWNSKKWRQLFIVDKDIILGIKAYPYRSDALTQEVTKWLKNLAETNMGWSYTTEEPIKWSGEPICDDTVKLDFVSNHMYTDVSPGQYSYYYLYTGSNIETEHLPVWKDGKKYWEFNYSGASQCVWCGDLNTNFSDSSCVFCTECEDVVRCSYCGNCIEPGSGYIVGDEALCEYCYYDQIMKCEACYDDTYNDDTNPIVIFPRMSEETAKWAIENNYVLPKRIAMREDAEEYFPVFADYTIWVCPECYNGAFEEKYLKENRRLFAFEDDCGNRREGCYIDDLNEDGMNNILTESMRTAMEDESIDEKRFIKNFFNYDFKYIRMLSQSKNLF